VEVPTPQKGQSNGGERSSSTAGGVVWESKRRVNPFAETLLRVKPFALTGSELESLTAPTLNQKKKGTKGRMLPAKDTAPNKQIQP